MREEIYRKLYLAVGELPERNRVIFVLFVLGMSREEIAEALSLSVRVVNDNKNITIRFLKQRLGDHYSWFSWMRNVQIKQRG